MIKIKQFNENTQILNLINELIDKERKQGMEYPRAVAYLNYYNDLLTVSGKKKVIELTNELFSYLAYGDKYSIEMHSEADKIRNTLRDLAIEKRKLVFPSYDTRLLDDFINHYKYSIIEVWEDKNAPENRTYKQSFRYLNDIKYLLKNPYIFGIPEETGFLTIRQEIYHYIKLLCRESKRQANLFDNKEIINKLREIIKEIL